MVLLSGWISQGQVRASTPILPALDGDLSCELSGGDLDQVSAAINSDMGLSIFQYEQCSLARTDEVWSIIVEVPREI